MVLTDSKDKVIRDTLPAVKTQLDKMAIDGLLCGLPGKLKLWCLGVWPDAMTHVTADSL